MRILRILLAVMLLGGLAWAGVRIYRRLPPAAANDWSANGTQQDLTIFVRVQGSVETRIKLYPMDFANVERDYARSGRQGRTFEDFLAQRLKNLTPVIADADANGRAVAHVNEGTWWIHAVTAFSEDEWLEWRQQVTVAQHPQTIELTSDNAYQRSKKF